MAHQVQHNGILAQLKDILYWNTGWILSTRLEQFATSNNTINGLTPVTSFLSQSKKKKKMHLVPALCCWFLWLCFMLVNVQHQHYWDKMGERSKLPLYSSIAVITVRRSRNQSTTHQLGTQANHQTVALWIFHTVAQRAGGGMMNCFL